MPNKPLAQLYHFSSFGKRQEKYDLLNNTEFKDVAWKELEIKEPYYFFVPKDFGAEEKYNQGFSVSKIFNLNAGGYQTKRDELFIKDSKEKLINNIGNAINNNLSESEKIIFNIQNSSSYDLLSRLNKSNYNENNIIKTQYRPFDIKYIYYDPYLIGRNAYLICKNFVGKSNIGLVFRKTAENSTDWQQIFVSDKIVDINFLSAQTYFFPLYLYQKPEETQTEIPLSQRGQGDCKVQKVQGDYLNLIPPTPFEKGIVEQERIPNFNPEIIETIEEKLGLKLIPLSQRGQGDYQSQREYPKEKGLENTFSPENLFDYIYAVLHSQTYRETYKEFLKIDFPKIPFDTDKETFFEMAKLGEELRSYHLLENENLIPKNFITKYEVDGDNKIEKVSFSIPPFSKGVGGLLNSDSTNNGSGPIVKINDSQYFSGVPETTWNFYIGGYQPAQKWLKDRKGRNLNYEDIIHYSKIILSLEKTIEIMEKIDKYFYNFNKK